MYEIYEDAMPLYDEDLLIGKTKTFKEATRLAKREAIKRVNRVFVYYRKGNSAFSTDFRVIFDPRGKQY